MKIKQGLLKQIEKDKLGTDELYSEHTYQYIASLYNDAVSKYMKRHSFFYSPSLSEKQKKRQTNQIKKFIEVCIKFELPFDKVMDNQIKILAKFMKEGKLKIKGVRYPPFAMLISENGQKRLEYMKGAISRKYTGSARRQELSRVHFLDIEKSLRNSMNKVYDRFRQTRELIGTLQKFEAVQELEVMARAKLVSNIYVHSSPLSEETEFLKEVKKEAGQRLSDQQKEAIMQIKKDLMSEFKDKEILKYV